MKVTTNGTNIFGMPLLDFPRVALPGAIGDLAEQGLVRAQAASKQMTEALGEAYSCNARGATDYGLKVFEISHANAASALDFFVHLLGSKSATDVLTLSTEHARKAFDMASDQNKELWALGQKLATETSEPVKKHFARVFHQAG
ncbi:phasin [Bradyrhizobium sp. i1.8.4]|uniref:phasin family protein n=1 Tax=unclassified Bradyrhizobium TaxID=2631580 RepID=UPI003D1DFFBE